MTEDEKFLKNKVHSNCEKINAIIFKTNRSGLKNPA